MTLAPAKFKVAMWNGLGVYAFTRKNYLTLTLIQIVTKYPLFHVTYAPAKFEAATSNSLGDAFTSK